MAYEGSLAEAPFTEVLQYIARNGDTGILTLQGEEEIIGVTFLDGDVVSVDAVNQAPEEGLGVVLDEEDLVSMEAFTSLVAENRAGGGRVTDLLIERNYLTREQLLAAMRRQALDLCRQACQWRQGQFRFYRGDQVSYEQGVEPLEVEHLLATLAEPPDEVAEPPRDLSADTADRADAPPGEVPEVELLDLGPALAAEADAYEGAFQPGGGASISESFVPPSGEPAAGEVGTPEVEPLEVESLEVGSLAVGYSEEAYAEIGYPEVEMPDPEPEDEFEEPRRRRLDIDWREFWGSSLSPVLPGRLLALGLLVSLVGLVVMAPGRFLLPLGGQERIRAGIATGVQDSVYTKIDRAARTHFLLEGEFPGQLADLVALRLLAAGDLAVSGREFEFTRAPLSYQLALDGARSDPGAVRIETIRGNFLLDPDYSPPEVLARPSLFLLD